MLPGGAVAAGAAGRPAVRGDGRAAARANLLLGLAMAAMALFAATTTFPAQAQIIDLAAPAPAQQCAATEEEALGLRGEALYLVLAGVAQAVVAAAADVAFAGSLRVLGRCLTVLAHLIGAMNTCSLCYVVGAVAVVASGHCAGQYLGGLTLGYALVAASYAGLFGVSVAVTCC